MKVVKLIILVLISFNAGAQNIELVISTSLTFTQHSAFSNTGKFLANGAMRNIYIWDVKTGREIRRVQFTDNDTHYIDSIWFTPDDKKVVVGLMFNNDQYHIEMKSGKVEYVSSAIPFRHTFPIKMSRSTLATEHMMSSSKEDLIYHSPNKEHELRLRKVKNPFDKSGAMPYNFVSVLKTGNRESVQNDTNYLSDISFSKDSKYIFSNQRIYNAQTHRMVSELKTAAYTPVGISFLPGTHIPVTAAQDNIRIWDFPKIRTIPTKGSGSVTFSPGYTYAIADLYDRKSNSKKIVRIDMKNEMVVNRAEVPMKNISYITSVGKDAESFCMTDQRSNKNDIYTISFKGVQVDVLKSKIIREFKNASNLLQTADPDLFIVDSVGLNIHVQSASKDFVREYPEADGRNYAYAPKLSNDLRFGLGWSIHLPDTVTKKSYIELNAWEIQSGDLRFRKIIDDQVLTAFQISADHSMYACGNTRGAIFIYDFKTGELLHEFDKHNSNVLELAFSDDGKRMLSASLDGSRRLWNLETGKEVVSLISIGKNDYAIVTPDQYYYATKGAHGKIHFVRGTEIFPFAQFDLKYNRPDIILERMMASNEDMIRPFYLAYQKRLKRLGFTESMLDGEFHLPEARISNGNELPIVSESKTVQLEIHGSDSKYFLDRLLVRVNGVPIHGSKGLSFAGLEIRNLDKKIEIELAPGKNLISVSVWNEKGVESIADYLEVKYVPADTKLPELHLLTLGVSEYEDSRYDLKYASKDARDLSRLYSDTHLPFDKVHIHQLVDRDVTNDNINTLYQALKETHVEDVVCVFFAGHGLLDSNLDYYLASHDIQFNDPAINGIPYESLENLLDGIPARCKLLMIDACHSGEIDRDEIAEVQELSSSNQDVVFRSVGSSGMKQIGLNNSFELMKELFADLKKSSGTMIISSAGGTEYAMEGDQWQNGVFTYCLLNGLKNGSADINEDGQIMMSEINDYVRKKVNYLTNGAQQPTNRAEVLEVDFRLW